MRISLTNIRALDSVIYLNIVSHSYPAVDKSKGDFNNEKEMLLSKEQFFLVKDVIKLSKALSLDGEYYHVWGCSVRPGDHNGFLECNKNVLGGRGCVWNSQ